MESAAQDFKAMFEGGDKFTEGQLSYIDSIYEKTMSGAGMDSVGLHIDRKRKGLRYG